MADEYFSRTSKGDDESAKDDPAAAMTKCCSRVFGKLTQTAAWGLAALQSLTIGDSLEKMPEGQRQTIQNLPARVYYGVNSDEALALRVLGVPRVASGPMTQELGVKANEPLSALRGRLIGTSEARWVAAVGKDGASFRRVWNIIEGRGDEFPDV